MSRRFLVLYFLLPDDLKRLSFGVIFLWRPWLLHIGILTGWLFIKEVLVGLTNRSFNLWVLWRACFFPLLVFKQVLVKVLSGLCLQSILCAVYEKLILVQWLILPVFQERTWALWRLVDLFFLLLWSLTVVTNFDAFLLFLVVIELVKELNCLVEAIVILNLLIEVLDLVFWRGFNRISILTYYLINNTLDVNLFLGFGLSVAVRNIRRRHVFLILLDVLWLVHRKSCCCSTLAWWALHSILLAWILRQLGLSLWPCCIS